MLGVQTERGSHPYGVALPVPGQFFDVIGQIVNSLFTDDGGQSYRFDRDGTCVGLEGASDQVEQCRLSRTVGADKSRPSWPKIERGILDDRHGRRIGERHVVEMDSRHGNSLCGTGACGPEAVGPQLVLVMSSSSAVRALYSVTTIR